MTRPERQMQHATIVIRADWDDEAQVWVATSDDVEGLVTEAETLEALRPKVLAMVAELLQFNGQLSELPEIPISIMAEQTARIRNPQWT